MKKYLFLIFFILPLATQAVTFSQPEIDINDTAPIGHADCSAGGAQLNSFDSSFNFLSAVGCTNSDSQRSMLVDDIPSFGFYGFADKTHATGNTPYQVIIIEGAGLTGDYTHDHSVALDEQSYFICNGACSGGGGGGGGMATSSFITAVSGNFMSATGFDLNSITGFFTDQLHYLAGLWIALYTGLINWIVAIMIIASTVSVAYLAFRFMRH